MTKKKISIILIFLFFMLFNQSYAQELKLNDTLYSHVINKTILPLCKAMKNGNVTLIKRYITGNLYKECKVLLEQNTKYPEFLRNFYQGAKFRVGKAIKSNDNTIIVDVTIEFPNGDYSSRKFVLKEKKDSSQKGNVHGTWRVRDMEMEPGE